MIATIEGIEQDYEGKFQLAVVVDDDPEPGPGDEEATARTSLLFLSGK